MPHSGDINLTFSVYKNGCCGREIVVREGATFPECPDHSGAITICEPLPTEISELRPIKKSKPDSVA